MEYVTAKEFSKVIRGIGLTNADSELDFEDNTVWRFPGEKRVAGMIERDHNGTFHYAAKELL